MTRRLPEVRGRTRLARALDRIFGIPLESNEATVDVRARDGSRWRLDLRTTYERQAFWSGRYEERTSALAESRLRKGDVVVDAGANVGFFTIRLARRLQRLGGGRIHAFEPIPENALRLAHNVEANGVGDIVRIHECALGAFEGRVDFHRQNEYGATTGNAAMIGASMSTLDADMDAEVTTLDAFAERENLTSCALLKLDVEGAELEVLRGGEATIARLRPPILAEYNDYWAEQFGWSRAAYADFMKAYRYRANWVEDRVDPIFGKRVANVFLDPL